VRRFLIWFPATVAALLLLALALPLGEIVTLYTVDSDGREHASALWVAEVEGVLHLRADDPTSSWFVRLGTHPLVELERDDPRRHYRATVATDPAVLDAVNDAMTTKYGVADRLFRRVVDVNRSVPVRLDPIEGLDDSPGH